LLPINNDERVAINIEFIARGNHKSTIKYNDEYSKIVKAEISQGWMFPIPLHYINSLKHGELVPVGIDD
jgi:ATP sulfurylase